MKADELNFPVLYFDGYGVTVKVGIDEINRCTALALKNTYFKKVLLVDKTGSAFRISSAEQIRRSWLSIIPPGIFNPLIRVCLSLTEDASMTVEDVKELVFQSFTKRSEWRSRTDYAELLQGVKNAQTIFQIMEAIRPTT